MLLVDDRDADGQVVADGTGAVVFYPRYAEVRVSLRMPTALTRLVLDPSR